jgi:hypothetical protein
MSFRSGTVETVFTLEMPARDQTFTFSVTNRDFVSPNFVDALVSNNKPTPGDIEAAFISKNQLVKFLQLFEKLVVGQIASSDDALNERELVTQMKEEAAAKISAVDGKLPNI